MSYIIWKPNGDIHSLALFMKSIGNDKNKKDLRAAFFIFSLLLLELTWLHTNPSIYSEKIFEDIPDLYFAKDEKTSLENIKIIEDAVKNTGVSKIIFIRGKKGSGKTFSLGYFLNKKTRDLNNQGITWFRIDATKIYELRYKYPTVFNILASKGILLESYLYSQIFFVLSRYHNTDSVLKGINFNEILKEISEEKAIPIEELREIFIKLTNEAINAPNFNNSLNGKPWIKLCKEESFDFLKSFSLKSLSHLKKQGKQVVLFLDGIDNVDYDLKHFELVLNEIRDLLWGDKIELQDYFSKIIVFSRPEIYEKITFDVKAQSYGIEVRDLKTIPIEEILFHISSLFDKRRMEKLSEKIFKNWNLKEIIDKFIKSVDEFIDTFFEESCENKKWNDLNFLFRERILEQLSIENNDDIKKIKAGYIIILILALMRYYRFQEFSKDFKTYKDYFVSSFKKKLKEISKFLEEKYEYKFFNDKELTDSYVWSKVFSSNIRDIFLSLFHSYFYIKAYLNARKFPYPDVESYFEAYDFNNNQIQGEVKSRRLKIILEATFKFGKKYAPWISEKIYVPPYSSFPFLNFFNPSYVGRSDISPFYSLVIIDSLLKAIKDGFSISKDELLSRVVSNENLNLNLKKELESKILSPLVEFGYLSIKENSKIILTPKGIFAFGSFFTDINIMTSNIFYGLFDNKIFHEIFSLKNLEIPPFKLYPEIWQGYLSTTLYNLYVLFAYLYEETWKLKWFEQFKKLINNSYIKRMFFEFEKFLALNERERAFYELSLNRLKDTINDGEILEFLQEIFYENEKEEKENIIATLSEAMPIVLKELIDLEWKKYLNKELDTNKSLNIFQIYKLFKIPKDIAQLELYKFIGKEKYKVLKEQYENIYRNSATKIGSDYQDIASFIQSLYLYIQIKERVINYYKEFQQNYSNKEINLDSFLEWLKEKNIINPT